MYGSWQNKENVKEVIKKNYFFSIFFFFLETLVLQVLRFYALHLLHQYASIELLKLDGVGPVDNRHSTKKLHHSVRKKKQKYMWQVTHDM